jgi:hypothetical protein
MQLGLGQYLWLLLFCDAFHQTECQNKSNEDRTITAHDAIVLFAKERSSTLL